MAYDDRPAWARRLRQARISKGWSQRKLAQKLEACAGATERVLPARESLVRMIRGWEAGDHLPEPFHRWLLAQVLDIAEEELFEPSDGTLVMVSARGISTAQWSLLTRIDAALQRLKGDTDMERRALLRLLARLGIGVVLPDPEPWERLSSVLRRPSSIDVATVEDLEADTVALYRREECSPAKQVFADTVSHLNLLTTLVESAPRSSRLRRRLVVTAGEPPRWPAGSPTRPATSGGLSAITRLRSTRPRMLVISHSRPMCSATGPIRHRRWRPRSCLRKPRRTWLIRRA